MTTNFVESAKSGKSVFITDVRKKFSSLPDHQSILCLLTLPDGARVKHFTIALPPESPTGPAEQAFLQDYIEAEVYNHLTTLGGVGLDIYVPEGQDWIRAAADKMVETFGIEKSRADRSGYARIINVADRMLNALYPPLAGEEPKAFSISIHETDSFPVVPDVVKFQAAETGIFTKVTAGLDGRILCGLDIGGTDIKAAIAVNGELTSLKEYDWNPAAYGTAEELIDPILLIVRLLRAAVTVQDSAELAGQEVGKLLGLALRKEAEIQEIHSAVESAEKVLGDNLAELDAIGLCFPDVVVKNKVVGGEVPKTKGMRDNTALNFEDQFKKITNLDEMLLELCRPGGVVMNTNDGPMASFTAAVELAASPHAAQIADGVFAHTLGTDLGTGLVLGDGTIPEIPLEGYNMVVDLGSYPARKLPAEDARSMNNTNTGIAGTLQRFTSQTGAFRLALKYFPESRPDLMEELREKGFLKTITKDQRDLEWVPETPIDMRKSLLAHLMDLTVRENDAATGRVFKDIGTFLAVVWEETEYILQTGISRRFLFGRLVKIAKCFDLMSEGAAERVKDLELVAADGEMAFTPLMKSLDANPEYTVAQFGQAIGAIYFGNLGLVKDPK